MESALILADRILQVIRESGANKVEALCALEVAHKVLPSVDEMSFSRPAESEGQTAVDS
jgi:hypothetical protein